MTDDSTIMEDPTGESVGLIDEVVRRASPLSFADRQGYSPVSDQQPGASVLRLHHPPRRRGSHFPRALSPHRDSSRVGVSWPFHHSVMESYWQAQLPRHLLHFLEGEDYDEVMMYASELLFSLCAYKQRVDSFAEHPVGVGGGSEAQEWVEQLLVVLSRWRSHDPESLDEAEILENLFNVLCMMIVRAGRVGEHVAVLSGAAHTAREGAAGPASDPHSQAQVRASRGAEGGCGRVK